MPRDERKGGKAARVPCRRLTVERTVDDHRRCPYCFGRAEDVASGKHARFCDFDAERDPIVFGFPTRFGRYAAE
jgi:hypothetical protein